MTICTKATAIHEAGHIVATKRYLLGYYEILIRPGDGGPIIDGHGRKSYDLGMMDGAAFDWDVMGKDHISNWNFGDDREDMVSKINEHGLRHIIVNNGGPIAEARHSRRSIAAIALGPGHGDFRQSKSIIASEREIRRCRIEIPRARFIREITAWIGDDLRLADLVALFAMSMAVDPCDDLRISIDQRVLVGAISEVKVLCAVAGGAQERWSMVADDGAMARSW